MPGEHWITVAELHHEPYLADSLGSPSTIAFFYSRITAKYFGQNFKITSVYAVSTQFLQVRLFKFQQEEITGVHDVNVLSFISNFMFLIENLLYMCKLYMVFVEIYTF